MIKLIHLPEHKAILHVLPNSDWFLSKANDKYHQEIEPESIKLNIHNGGIEWLFKLMEYTHNHWDSIDELVAIHR